MRHPKETNRSFDLVFIPSKRGYLPVQWSQITAIVVSDHLLKLYLVTGETYNWHGSLKNLMIRIKEDVPHNEMFVQISRDCVINLVHVVEMVREDNTYIVSIRNMAQRKKVRSKNAKILIERLIL